MVQFLPESQVRTLLDSIGTRKRFTVWFAKSDGSIRKMLCQMGVKKYLQGTGGPLPSHLISVYDHEKKGYRCFPVAKVIRLRSGDLDTGE